MKLVQVERQFRVSRGVMGISRDVTGISVQGPEGEGPCKPHEKV